MKKGYTAFNIPASSKQSILSVFQPKFKNIVCHHITYKFNVFENDEIPSVKKAIVVGYAEDENAQVAVVEIEGTSERPDGRIFHITICHNDKVKPYYSNTLVEKGFVKITPFEIDVKSSFNAF